MTVWRNIQKQLLFIVNLSTALKVMQLMTDACKTKSQLTFTCLKLTIEALEKNVKYVQS